jgi:hypothetical protein
MIKFSMISILVALVSIIGGSPTMAQTNLGEDEVAKEVEEKVAPTTAENSEVDLAVPVSPAFFILGMTPGKVIRPTSPKELVTSFLEGTDENGNFQTGLAIDVSPHLLFNRRLSLDDYNGGKFKDLADPKNKSISLPNLNTLLARTQLSFATTKGISDKDDTVRIALGLNITPFDLGDTRSYRSEFQRCMHKASAGNGKLTLRYSSP